MENISPHSIYVDKRPLRVVYLIKKEDFSFEDFKKITKFNQEKWGGAYNPLIPVENGTVEESWMSFLKEYDPDVIDCLCDVDEQLLEKFDISLSPFLIHRSNDTDSLFQDGVSIVPSLKNIHTVSQASQPRIVLFESESNFGSEEIKDFLEINFGIYHRFEFVTNGKSSYSYETSIQKCLDENEVEILKIQSEKDLYEGLEKLSAFRPFVYPSQVSSLPSLHTRVQYNTPFSEDFVVILGDSPNDFIFFRNLKILRASSKRTELSCVWLPKNIATNQEYSEHLKKWLRKCADKNGTTQGKLDFVSFSLSEEELSSIATNLTPQFISTESHKLQEFPFPVFEQEYRIIQENPIIRTTPSPDVFTLRSSKESLTLNEADLEIAGSLNTYWVADIRIQEQEGKFIKLPQNNELAKRMFNVPCRMRKNGFPSLIMQGESPKVTITLLDSENIFPILILSNQEPRRTSDLRYVKEGRRHKVGWTGRLSDNGFCANGLLSLFGGLWSFYNFFEEKPWRDLFEKLSDSKKSIKEKVQDIIGNKTLDKNQKSSRLTSLVLGGKENGGRITFGQMTQHMKKGKKEERQELKEELSRLLKYNIFFPGITYICQQCGFENWKSINDIAQENVCDGCQDQFSFQAESEWTYKINSIVKKGVQQGVVPELVTLGDLFRFQQDSQIQFYFYPSIEVFSLEDESISTDIDLLCILNGEFVMGEIKESVSAFSSKDFKDRQFPNFIEIAKKIRPQKIIFAALENENPTTDFQKMMADTQKELDEFGITIEWHKFYPHLFNE